MRKKYVCLKENNGKSYLPIVHVKEVVDICCPANIVDYTCFVRPFITNKTMKTDFRLLYL